MQSRYVTIRNDSNYDVWIDSLYNKGWLYPTDKMRILVTRQEGQVHISVYRRTAEEETELVMIRTMRRGSTLALNSKSLEFVDLYRNYTPSDS